MVAATMCIMPQEYWGEERHPLRDDAPILAGMPRVVDGRFTVGDGPGLGM